MQFNRIAGKLARITFAGLSMSDKAKPEVQYNHG
jgi:hypothetical protein